MWWNDYWPMPWMFFGPVLMILFVIICATMVYFIMRGSMTTYRERGRDAIDLLKERFARGEINQTEYEERRRLLKT